MSHTVAGQSFSVVTCQSCENDLSFQNAASSKRLPAAPGAFEMTCSACGHLGSYSQAHIREDQAQYPL